MKISDLPSGVICGMEGALDFLNMGTLEGKTVAIQGAGNVGKAWSSYWKIITRLPQCQCF